MNNLQFDKKNVFLNLKRQYWFEKHSIKNNIQFEAKTLFLARSESFLIVN